MMLLRRTLLLLPLLLVGCAADTGSPLLQKVRALHADGTLTDTLPDQDLTPFQQLLRDRLPPEPPLPSAIFALEEDVPGGQGTEGEYLALVCSGSEVVLRYYEQEDHRPRTDRFYFRQLTPAEAFEFDTFFKSHPLADLQRSGPAAPAATEPASQPADATSPATEPAAAATDGPPIQFRFTDARQDGTRTLLIQSPGDDDHPVIDLLHLLAKFRDAAPFAARYSQTIPLTARALFADPRRRVLYVWHQGDDLRIVVAALQADGRVASGQAVESWLAYKEGRWQPSTPPPESAPPSQPASQPATEPAPAPAPEPPSTNPYANLPIKLLPTPAAFPNITAAQIRELMGPRLPPQVESWWTQPNQHSTTVLHYIPQPDAASGNPVVRSQKVGLTLGFVVPAFVFDDDHFAVDAARGTLYVVHDGQLFALPIPQAALTPPENPR